MKMARDDFIILLDLHEFFADDRQRSKIHINQNYKKITDLEERISEIFNIKEFHLLSDGHLLPSCEDISLLQSGEAVCVRPNKSSSQSILLSELYYTNHATKCDEKKITSKDEIALKLVQQEYNEDEKVLDGPEVTSKKGRIKEIICNGNDHNGNNKSLRKSDLYTSTPNSSNISPALTNPERIEHENKERIEAYATGSFKKKKRKYKSEKHDSQDDASFKPRKFKKRKHIVLNEENECGKAICKYDSELQCEGSQEISNLMENDVSGAKIIEINGTKGKKNSKKQPQVRNTLRYIGDEKLNDDASKAEQEGTKNLKSSQTAMPPQNLDLEQYEKRIESYITEPKEFYTQPLPHKKAKNSKSWSTAPLPKTSNLVKIIKVPAAKIEIDLSRFVYTPDDVEMENSSDNISNTGSTTVVLIETQNIPDTSQPKVQYAESHYTSESDMINSQKSLDQQNIPQIQFKNPSYVSRQNTLDTLQKSPEPPTTISVENSPTSDDENQKLKETNEMSPHCKTADQKSQAVSSLLDYTCNNFGFDQFATRDDSQDSGTPCKSKARELWRQKIVQKYIQNSENSETESCTRNEPSNMNESHINGPMEEKQIMLQTMDEIDESSKKSNCTINENMKVELIMEAPRSEEEHSAKDEQNSRKHEEIQTDRKFNISDSQDKCNVCIEEDSMFSNTTETDGNCPQPKRRRRRRHKNKVKNEIYPKEVMNISYANNVSWVPTKPRIHLRFDDSNEDFPVQNINPNDINGSQTGGFGDKIKILQNVSLIPDRNSQDETEVKNPHEEKGYVESIIEDVTSKNKDEIAKMAHENFERIKAELLKTFEGLVSEQKELQQIIHNNEC